jgi:hypothetical protein
LENSKSIKIMEEMAAFSWALALVVIVYILFRRVNKK